MAPIKELGGGGEERKETLFPSFPSPPPTFIFLALVSFIARPKPRIPFLGLSLLRNQTETLATQAIDLEKGCLSRSGPIAFLRGLFLPPRLLENIRHVDLVIEVKSVYHMIYNCPGV